MNSMHQSAFLNALAERHEVTLVTTESDSGRSVMGWEEPGLPNVRILSFDAIDWKALVRSRRGPGDWHVFAGLQAFRKVHAAFVYALALECRTGLYAEPLRMGGLAGLLKRMRGTIDGRRFGDRVGFVLCIGRESKRQFLQWGFPSDRLYDWAYVTEFREALQSGEPGEAGVRGIFPASLIHRKGADLLVEAVERLKGLQGLRIDAYCIDQKAITPWQRCLMERAEKGGILRIHPFIGNRSLLTEMANSDFTLLPSRFDGWGAVVNESLSVGTPVIVSRYCGASELLEGRPWMGQVLDDLDPSSIARAIEEAALSGRVESDRRKRITEWAQDAIAGERISRYFMDVVTCSETGGVPLRAPWDSAATPVHQLKTQS
jgi:glycosyltransferase involved in cell wall biosynthesis